MPFLKLIRFHNLSIIVLTQYLLQYLILIPAFEIIGLSPLLDHFHFSILAFSTVLIAAGGYIINDIYDIETDKINKKENQIIGNSISSKSAFNYYYLLNFLGFLFGFYIALSIGKTAFGFIFIFQFAFFIFIFKI